MVPNQAASVGGAIDLGVVHHHGDAIARQPDIELHGVGADLDGSLERSQRILRDLGARTTVRHHQRGSLLTERTFRH